MKKRILSILLCFCMAISLLPATALAAETQTICGLTITQTSGSGGVTINSNGTSVGMISITQAGAYTISGTYSGGNVSESDWSATQTTWRGIIDMTQVTGEVKLTLDNVNIETTYRRNMPIILSRANNGSANVEIELVGINTLIAGNLAGTGSSGLGNGAIVKQGGGGSLTFTGSGSLNAQATGVVIGSPYVINSIERQPYNCSNITFAQTGTITATTTDGYSSCVGAAAGYTSGGISLSATASNITVQSGTLNLVNTATDGNLTNGALLGCSGIIPSSAVYHDITVTGGKITTAISTSPGSNYYAIGGGTVSTGYKGVTVTGGTIVTASGLTFKAYDARSEVSGFAYGAYIAASDAVSSLSVKMDGETYPYTATGVEAQEGKVWLYLPSGNAAVTLSGTQYYGAVDSSGNTELKQAFNPVTGITGLPTDMSANSTITLAGMVAPADATFTSISKYEILDADTTGATLFGNSLTARAAGTVNLRATVGNGNGSTDYTQDFQVAVNYTPLTNITGVPDSIQNGVAVTLTPGFTPSDASYRSVAWSVKTGSATVNGNSVTPTAPGTLVLTATVANGAEYGTDYTKDFTITVPSVPVTNITASIPATLTISEELALSGSVTPGDASYKTITWSVEPGTTGAAITSGKLKATAAGTLTLRATVANGVSAGVDFTKEYTIQVLEAGNVLDIGSGNGILIESNDANNNKVTYAGYSDNFKIVPKTETLVITGNSGGKQIIIKDTTAKILLQDAQLSSTVGTNKSCIDLQGTASLVLSAEGSNTISVNGADDAAAIHVPTGTTLTIEDGGGSLSITSGNGAAIGGNCSRSGDGEAGGTVVINGGTVSASSQSYGASIGGGGSMSSGCTGGAGGTVTISGGIVSASSSQGAGIGGGYSGNGGTGGAGGSVTITGGVVTATGGYISAGIGGGGSSSNTGGAGGTVAISGGTVTANANTGYPGTMAIGGGKNSSTVAGNGTLTITGGSVTANRSITGGTSGSNTCVAATNGSNPVYKTTVDLSDTVGKNTALTGTNSIDGLTYGFNGVSTDGSGKIYLYLPENSHSATLNGVTGYTGSTSTDDAGILALGGLSATLQLGTPYLTGSGAVVSATPSLAGTVYYMAVKNGAAGAYADADALKNASGVKSVSVTANTVLTLTGMTALEGNYTVYAALISSSGSYKSAVMTGTLSVPATAPDSDDVSLDYSAETLKASSGLAYSLKCFTTAEATTGGTAITTGGVSITSLIGSTVYVRKVFTDSSVGGAALTVILPARPDVPAVPACTAAATSITVTPVSGEEYSIDGTSWNTLGSFTGLTEVKNYTVYARTAATSSAFASEPVSAIASTVATVNAPTKEGAGAAFAGNTVMTDKNTVGAGASVTYTITAISGYTPSLSINSTAVTLTDEGNGTYTYTYTPAEGTESISATATFEGTAIDHIVADSVTMFADDAYNESKAVLESYLGMLTVTAKDSSGSTLGTLDATYALSTGTWAATGGSYTYTATAGGKTCDMAVTVKTVNAAITAVSDITKMVRPVDGYTAHSAIGLPETVTVTYAGEGYTTKTENLSITWSAVPADFGKTAPPSPAAFTGTVSLPAWASGSNVITVSVTITPKNAATVAVTQANGVYGEALGDPQITVTDKDGGTLTDMTKLKNLYSGTTATGTDYGLSGDKPTQPGTYTVSVTYEDDANSGTGSAEFTIKEALSGSVSAALDTDGDGNGIADAGDTLKVTGITPPGATLTYVWKLNGTDAGTGSTYTVGAGDAGKRLTVTVTGTGYYTGTLTSAEYKIGARTLSGTVAVIGDTTVGSVLTAAFSATSGTPAMGDDYHVQWYRVSGGTTTEIVGTNALTYTLTNNELGKTLRVELIADISDSAYTGTVAQTIEIPAAMPEAPVITASAGSGKVTLSWSAPFDGGNPLTGYKLYFKSGSDAYGTAIEIAADTLSYEVTSLSNGTAYTFKLEAINALGTAESAEVTSTPAAQASGGGATSTTKGVTVHVSTGKGSIEATATMKDGTATISMTDAQIEEIASAATAGTIKIDVSALAVDAVVLPGQVVTAVNEASGSTGLAVVLPSGTVTLDKAALASVAGKGDIKISVEAVDNEKLTDSQREVLGAQTETALVVDVNVFVNGTQTSSFGDGVITVSVPYTLKAGDSTDSITVWFIKDDGTIEPKNGVYSAAMGCVEFTTEHLSQYLIVSFPFTDVAEDAWYYNSVAYAYNNGLFAGTSDTTFSPDTAMTRQMIWMVLARMDGKAPADMDAARNWAMENGISDGSNPTNSITREQMATILYRYAQYKGYDTTQGGMAIREFTDYDSISEYALTALGWSVNAGLMQGSGNNLMPSGSATRAQVATILQRFCQNVAG